MAETEPSADRAPAAAADIGAGPVRVLIADDDHDTVLTLMTVLRHEGHEVRGVYKGSDVLQTAKDFAPDAVLLDITMPGMSGYDVARALRERYGENGIVLIAVTAWTQPSDKLLARMVGFDHHFSKPFDVQALIDVLSAVRPKPKYE
jgi:DNA-binding response OmpR family regulator